MIKAWNFHCINPSSCSIEPLLIHRGQTARFSSFKVDRTENYTAHVLETADEKLGPVVENQPEEKVRRMNPSDHDEDEDEIESGEREKRTWKIQRALKCFLFRYTLFASLGAWN